MPRLNFRSTILGSTALAIGVLLSSAAFAEDVTLTIESWRNDDLPIWQEKIIPAFEKVNPGIKVVFSPTAPTEYNAALNTKLEAGTAGDLITCRPFDASLELFKKGQLTSVNDIAGMDTFNAVAKSAWSTDDGATTFCVPMASVIHGFIYNKDAFAKVGVDVPKTEEEFFAALDKINSSRAVYGASQNRFSAVITNLQTSVENQSAARSRIMDADFAAETANMSRAQILQQAGTAMVAQANQVPQNVLRLLQG